MSNKRTIRMTIEIDILADQADLTQAQQRLESNLDSAIQHGLLDAGDVQIVSYAPSFREWGGEGSSVTIRHWDAPQRSPGWADRAFVNNVSDQRQPNGQVFQSIRLADTDPDADLQLHVTTEINSLHGDETALPCAHINLDDDDGTVSLFRTPEGLIVRLDTGVSMERTSLPDGSTGYLIK